MAEKRTDSADLSALRINRDDAQSTSGGPGTARTSILVALALLVLAALGFTFLRTGAEPATLRFAEAGRVYPSQAEVTLTASGYVVAQRQAAIASKATGRLEQLRVEEGDRVKTGEIIAKLEHADVDAALAQARANLQMTEAALLQNEAGLKEARLHYERQRELLAQKLISASEFEVAEARFQSAAAGVAAAGAQIQVAQATVVSASVDVENTRIRAPFDGTVLTKNADIGEMVAPFAASSNSRGAVVTIADMSSLEVEADVSEANIQKVQAGLRCEIILDAFPGIRYPGTVHKIVPTADRAKATVQTKVRFDEIDGKVLPEMSAKVHFLTGGEADGGTLAPAVTAIPLSAVTDRSGKQVAFVVRAGKLSEIAITGGRTFSGQVEVGGGIEVGEKVVLNPTAELKAGMDVATD